MPTYEFEQRFLREFNALTPEQQQSFFDAITKFVDDLKRGQIRSGLRVKAFQGRRGWYELTWAPNGRALFEYGPEVRSGEAHVIWKRIGGHGIFENP